MEIIAENIKEDMNILGRIPFRFGHLPQGKIECRSSVWILVQNKVKFLQF